jgi:2-octaprenyl-6-methoxyphenol hydroxylase
MTTHDIRSADVPGTAPAAASTALRLAVIGAGPVGLALALLAAQRLPRAHVTLFDARPAEQDVSGDPRTLALSLGSVQLLQRLGAWQGQGEPILEVHVSQQPPSLGGALAEWLGEPEVRISAREEQVDMLGAVLSYGAIVAPLQRAWEAACAAAPTRLSSRFATPVRALKPLADGVEVDAGIAEAYDLAVVAEGGVFSETQTRSVSAPAREPLRHDYRQTAWVGTVTLEGAPRGVAFERFTRHGPAALLPLGAGKASLVWCVSSADDPVQDLSDTQRLAVLNTVFHPSVGRLTTLSPLKRFPLGLSAQRSLTERRTVRIGNAAQTLHPVAGQGLNLGLRDAYSLVQALSAKPVDAALRSLEWQRGPDRWAMIFATDFLARSFTWRLPGAGAARGLGMAALQALKPVKSLLARQMMFGSR